MRASRDEGLWVLRAQSDDREALELMLGSVQAPLHRYLCQLVGRDDADDVLQEVLVVIFRKLVCWKTRRCFGPGRAVLILHFQEDLSLADVAAILNVPVGTVKSRLAYGLAALRRQLSDRKRF